MLQKVGRTARRLCYTCRDTAAAALDPLAAGQPLYIVLVSYFLKPLALTSIFLFPLPGGQAGPIGRPRPSCFCGQPDAQFAFRTLRRRMVTEQVVRGLRGLQIHVLGAGLRLIIDFFQWILHAVEQLLYTVDEWLLFRTGEGRIALLSKAVLGAVWAAVSYVCGSA